MKTLWDALWKTRFLVFTGLFFLYSSSLSRAQERDLSLGFYNHQSGDFLLDFKGFYVQQGNYYERPAFGIHGSVWVNKFMSLETGLAIGQDYLHFGPGILGVLLALTYPDDDEEEDIGTTLGRLLLIATTAENINFHFPFSEKAEIVPYFSLLRIQYIWDQDLRIEDENHTGIFFSGRIGTKLNINPVGKLMVSPYIEGVRLYGRNGSWGFNAGVNVGILFLKK